jgi:hypothetical protein
MKASTTISAGFAAAISSLAYAFAYGALIISGASLSSSEVGYGVEGELIGS